MNTMDAVKKAKSDYNKKWRAENKERVKEYHRSWTKQNPQKVEQYQMTYWTKKAKEEGLLNE